MSAALAERIRAIEAQPLPANIDALLGEAAREVPDQVALHFTESGETITYARLRQRVTALAEGLRAVGVAAGTHVAVMLPNVPEMPLTWLALARLGAVMIPVNLRYTGRELAYMLEDGEADFLVIHESALPVLDTLPQPLPRLDGRIHVVGELPDAATGLADWQALERIGASRPVQQCIATLDTVLNLQYTSGTTGFPKGCILTQRYWILCAKSYGAFDGVRYRRLFADNPFFYMTPQWLTLMAFFHRASFYVAPRLSGSRFGPTIRAHRIDYCLFRDVYFREPADPQDMHNSLVRMNIYPHRSQDHAAMQARFACAIRPAFGMTEIGAGLIMPLEATHMVGSGSCGIAAPFRQCRIADLQGHELPHGTPGELLIRGPGLLLGYYRKPEATAAAFHGDWFRTGDLAVRDAEGYFSIVGRIKDMIRRAGENIAANEVEAVLDELPGVLESAALPVPDLLRGEEVMAHLVIGPGAARGAPGEILAHCARNLAPFKIPRYLAFRSAPLPRTASGKIAKQVLRDEDAHSAPEIWDRVQARWRPACDILLPSTT